MHLKQYGILILAGFFAGAVNALFGAGGGMILVPLLSLSLLLQEQEIFPASVCIIAPICIISIYFYAKQDDIPWKPALPYLLGSVAGGILSGVWGKKIPVKWLHRVLGIMILWGGIRYLC